MKYILRVNDISKTIEEKKILHNFTIDINQGSVHALLGPNGAGKTSLLKIILGISQPDHGTIEFNGNFLKIPYSKETRMKIGFLPDEPILINYLTGLENLTYMNHIYGNSHNLDSLISILSKNGIESAKDVLVKNYSKGMKQRLSLSIIDLYNPTLLILDEPTLGLDIVAVNHLKNNLQEYKARGCTILLTTHDIHFCQEISDYVSLIDHGENIDEGTTEEWLLKYNNIEEAMVEKLKIKI